ncbi:MAG: hypothetical protein ACRD3C_10125 [Vicinamibacterales bacterium]
MDVIPVRIAPGGFGSTARRDVWWATPLAVFIGLSLFVVYATWAALQNAHYTYGPYLSPFYSPELFGDSPHAWLGSKPAWIPPWVPFSPALLILPFPGLFRVTWGVGGCVPGYCVCPLDSCLCVFPRSTS